jgi:hypothetical protein
MRYFGLLPKSKPHKIIVDEWLILVLLDGYFHINYHSCDIENQFSMRHFSFFFKLCMRMLSHCGNEFPFDGVNVEGFFFLLTLCQRQKTYAQSPCKF